MKHFFSSLIFSGFSILKVLSLIDILKTKNVNSVNCFVCDNSTIPTVHDFAEFNIFVAVKHLSSCNNSSKFHISKNFKVGNVIDATCPGWTDAVDFNDYSMFKKPFIWFFITNDLQSTTTFLSKYPIHLDSDVTIIYNMGPSNSLLYEVYNTGFQVNGEFITNSIGFRNGTLNIFKRERRDLRQMVIKCVVVVTQYIANETFEHFLKRPKQNTFDSLHKLKSFTILEYFREMYNFKYDLVRTNSWGYIRNGNFDGLVGALQRQEAEIGSTPLFFRKDRLMFIDYVAQTWQSRPCFIFRHPKHPGGYLSIYTRPLSNIVWYVIMTLLALAGAFLWCIFKLRVFGGDEDSSIAFLFVLSAVCQQGMPLNADSLSLKITVFVTFVFTLTLYQYYNATVVSTLLHETPKNIKTLNDLLRSNLKAGVEDVLYDKDYFKRTTDPIALELYHKKIDNGKSNNFYSVEHGLWLVKSGGFAFHVDSSAAYFVMRRMFSEAELCDLQEVALYPPQNMGAVVRKGSPYKELIAYGLRKMFEAGLMHRLKSVWDVPKPPCVRTPESSMFAVSIREFSMALIILFFGMVTSVLVLFCEIITAFIKDKRRVFDY